MYSTAYICESASIHILKRVKITVETSLFFTIVSLYIETLTHPCRKTGLGLTFLNKAKAWSTVDTVICIYIYTPAYIPYSHTIQGKYEQHEHTCNARTIYITAYGWNYNQLLHMGILHTLCAREHTHISVCVYSVSQFYTWKVSVYSMDKR